MVNKAINNLRDRFEEHLRRVCGRITPGKRVAVILTMLLLFGGLSIYMTVSSIYNFGKDKGRQMEIQRIETLKLEYERQEPADIQQQESINELKEFEYERPTE